MTLAAISLPSGDQEGPVKKIGEKTSGRFFTASTCSLLPSTFDGANVGAIVSRGGRPDLAGNVLQRVAAPVLLIVGSNDPDVLDLNRGAAERIRAETRVEVVSGATHLFEEPGALDIVAELATSWFVRNLVERVRSA